MFPVRCYTCNSVVAHVHKEYEESLVKGASSKDALDALGVHRMCCRRMFLSYVDLVTQQMRFPNVDTVLDETGTVLRRLCTHERVVSCE